MMDDDTIRESVHALWADYDMLYALRVLCRHGMSQHALSGRLCVPDEILIVALDKLKSLKLVDKAAPAHWEATYKGHRIMEFYEDVGPLTPKERAAYSR